MNCNRLYIMQNFTYACMHRDMQSNTPLRFYEFASHLEILNAGGLYGNARPENFPSVNDYRNPLIASTMKTMGYVNMFNRGVGQVQADLKENGNQPAEFNVNLITAFKVDVKVAQNYVTDNGGNVGGKDVPSSSQVLSQVVTRLSQDCHKLEGQRLKNAAKTLITLFNAPLSLKVLMESVGESNRGRMKENVVVPLSDAGLIELTIPDIPNSPKQQYALTEKGRRLFKVEGQT